MALIADNREDLETIGANPQAIADAERLTDTLTFAVEPEIYVDRSDGGITLDWFNSKDATAFALCFMGNGDVIGVRSPSHVEHPVWRKNVADIEDICAATNRVILATLR